MQLAATTELHLDHASASTEPGTYSTALPKSNQVFSHNEPHRAAESRT